MPRYKAVFTRRIERVVFFIASSDDVADDRAEWMEKRNHVSSAGNDTIGEWELSSVGEDDG